MDDEQALWIETGEVLGSFLLRIGHLLKRLGGVSRTLDDTGNDTETAQPHAGPRDSPEHPTALGQSD
jgi:hypothetical protein